MDVICTYLWRLLLCKWDGPRYFVFGKLFDESGELWYEGTFHFKRSSLGYPLFEGEKSFKDGIDFKSKRDYISEEEAINIKIIKQ